MKPKLEQFANQQVLNLETYRNDGQAMRTPVWFAEDSGVLFLHTVKNSGKVKRIRRTARVRVAPCAMLGTVKGEWIEGEARVLDVDGARRVDELLDRRCGAANAEFERRNHLRSAAQDAIEIRV